MTLHRVLLGAGEFAYRRAGIAGAEPVVILHAMGTDGSDWSAVMTALAARFEVLALDQRGHGQSCRPPHYSFEAMRDDLAQFAEALGLDRFNLIGHSMGGSVAVLFAERHPERLLRLVLVDTPPPSGRQQVPAPPEVPAEPVPFDWAVLAPIIAQLNRPDPAWWADLGEIAAPTLVVGGGAESFIPQGELAEVAAAVADGRLVTIEGGGHSVHENRPAEFLETVLAFLATPA